MNPRSIRFRLTAWYGGFLLLAFILLGAVIYATLKEHLESTLAKSLALRGRQLGNTLISNIHETGESFVIEKINMGFAPELIERFVRITRPDGTTLYISGVPKSMSFDPAEISPRDPTLLKKHKRIQSLRKGGRLFLVALPYTAGATNEKYWIEVGALTQGMDDALQGLLVALLVSMPLLVGIALGGGYFLVNRALKPVDELVAAAEKITIDRLNQRLPLQETGDELQRLGISLNKMIVRLEKAFQHTSRFSADASHELRTPLTIMRCELDNLALDRTLSEEAKERIESILEEVDYLTKIVEGLFIISRLESGETPIERARLAFSELASSTTEQMLLLAVEKGVSLKCDSTQKVEVEGDAVRLKQVMVNLIDNAIKFTPQGGQIRLRVFSGGPFAFLEVSDTGIGIPQDMLSQVFERFFCADKSHAREAGGSGLGLSIVRSICHAHGGRIDVESSEGKGARFRVQLPLCGSTTPMPTPIPE